MRGFDQSFIDNAKKRGLLVTEHPTKAGISKSQNNGSDKVKKSKYGNKKTEVEGIKFDSQKEAKRYQDLKIQQFAGEISDLKLQVRFDLIVNGQKVAVYVADFQYFKDGKEVVEDVKGMKTAIYRLKKKLMKAVYGIEILET